MSVQETRYGATSLLDIAADFDLRELDARSRAQGSPTQRGKRDAAIEAETWAQAASILRRTTISKGGKP